MTGLFNNASFVVVCGYSLATLCTVLGLAQAEL